MTTRTLKCDWCQRPLPKRPAGRKGTLCLIGLLPNAPHRDLFAGVFCHVTCQRAAEVARRLERA